jgi:hypothetical protein
VPAPRTCINSRFERFILLSSLIYGEQKNPDEPGFGFALFVHG